MPLSPSTDTQYFESKRDWWLVMIIWGAIAISLLGGIVPVYLEETSRAVKFVVVVMCLGADGLMLWVLYGTHYTLTKDSLQIQSGPFKFPIALDQINAISPTRNPLASPACSLDRLKIEYLNFQGSIMISPKDKPGFLGAIMKQCPNLKGGQDRASL